MDIQQQDLRAVIWPLLNPDTGMMLCDGFSWRDLEPKAGEYDFAGIARAIEKAKSIKRFALLHIEPEAPAWSLTPVDDFLRLIGAVGKAFGEERAVWGVDVVCPGTETLRTAEELQAIADAFRLAFPHAMLFVCAGSAFEGLLKGCAKIGLIVTPQNVQACGDSWRQMPLRMQVDASDAAGIQQAIDAHVSILETCDASLSNAATHAGHRFQWQSLQLDEREKEHHLLGITVALANAGSLPCYADAHFQVRLSGSDVDCDRVYPLPLMASAVKPGDRLTLSQQLDTTGMPSGEYELQLGLFCDGCGYPISLGIEGRISDGYYEGRLIVSL